METDDFFDDNKCILDEFDDSLKAEDDSVKAEIDAYKQLTDKELFQRWKGYYCLCFVYQCYSRRDLFELRLSESELLNRGMESDIQTFIESMEECRLCYEREEGDVDCDGCKFRNRN